MFISFEGIDGSGKSTQARLLAETLRQRDLEVVEVREPGGTPLGEEVRSLLLDPSQDIDPKAELLLFSAARAQLVTAFIKPALAEGAIVIADRFFDSTTVYQGEGRRVARSKWLSSLNQYTTGGLTPRRTYLVDVAVEIAAARRLGTEADRMEAAGINFYRRVREGYISLAASCGERILLLDGSRPVEEIHQTVTADFETLAS